MEFENAIRTDEQQHGGATLTKEYGNINDACTAQQRARNTHLSDVAGVGGDGARAGGGSSRACAGCAGASGHANVVDLVVGS